MSIGGLPFNKVVRRIVPWNRMSEKTGSAIHAGRGNGSGTFIRRRMVEQSEEEKDNRIESTGPESVSWKQEINNGRG